MSDLSLYKRLTRERPMVGSDSEKPVALIVDDEKPILNALRRLFIRSGIKVHLAESGSEGLAILRHQHVDVVISDMRMPKMDGGQFLAIVAEKHPDTVRIVLTGHSDLHQTIEVVNTAKIYQYIYKPWDDVDLLQTVRAGIEQARLIQENKRLVHLTQDQNEQLIELNAQLQMDIHERTGELQKTTQALVSAYRDEQKLREEQERAEKENAAKSRFLATISHEIRSPLNAVITMNSLLLSSELSEDQRNYALLAKEGGETLMALVNDILDLSKLEGGYLDLVEDWFNPVEMTERLTELYFNQAHRKNIDLQCAIDPRVNKLFYGDKNRIRQLVINLISNAVKFTEKGGVAIHCFLNDADALCWRIVDTGIGIDAADREKIFGYFVQADGEDNRRFGGSGLGLSIVKHLVEKMEGEIDLDSTKSKGSSFIVRLPLRSKLNKIEDQQNSGKARSIKIPELKVEASVIYIGGQLTGVDTLGAQLDYSVNAKWRHLSLDELDCDQLAGEYIIVNTASFSSINTLLTKMSKIKLAGCRLIAYADCINKEDAAALRSCGFDDVLKKPALPSILCAMLCANDRSTFSVEQACAVEISAPNFEKTHDKEQKDAGTKIPNIASKERYDVLAAEDSYANRAILQAILKNKPFNIDFAYNGLEALEKASKKYYDVILMDLAMPEMDGVAAAKAIRARAHANKKTPIIAMTANAQYSDRNRCLDAGMNDFVAKPIDIDVFMASLKSWLPEKKINNNVAEIDGEQDLNINDHEEGIDKSKINRLAQDATWPVLHEIVEIYIQESTNRVEKMNEFLKKGNYAAIADEAHALKSSSGSFGAESIYRLAKSLEYEAKIANSTLVKQHVDSVSKKLDGVMIALRTYISSKLET